MTLLPMPKGVILSGMLCTLTAGGGGGGGCVVTAAIGAVAELMIFESLFGNPKIHIVTKLPFKEQSHSNYFS